MSTDKRPPVIVSLNVEGFGDNAEDTQEIDRDRWDCMSPKERQELLDDLAEVHAMNHVGWGWHIYNRPTSRRRRADPMAVLSREVTDLPKGTRIVTDDPGVGALTVTDTWFNAAGEGLPASVEVDVTLRPGADIPGGDPQRLADLVGADSAWWLGSRPVLRYRLWLRADAAVPTIDDETQR